MSLAAWAWVRRACRECTSCKTARSIVLILAWTAPLLAQSGNLTPPLPNWGLPTYLSDYPMASVDNGEGAVPFVSGACSATPVTGGLAFTFSISDSRALPATPTQPAAKGALSTSAVVYDTVTNRLAATLWNGVTIANGTYCGNWNGDLDTGAAPSPAPPGDSYQVRLLHNNVQYTWDGMVGVTESSLAGPENWDSAGSFPAGMTFIDFPNASGTTTDWGVIAGGYNEQRLEAFVFKNFDTGSKTGDADTLWPLNLALQTGGEFDFAANDGNVVYFGARGTFSSSSNAVAGFTLTNTLPPMTKNAPAEIVTTNSDGSQAFSSVPITTYGQAPWGNPFIFSAVRQSLPPRSGAPVYFANAPASLVLSNAAVAHSVASVAQIASFDNGVAVGATVTGTQSVVDPSGKTETLNTYGDPITGVAVQRDSASPGNLLAVAHGISGTGCNTVTTGGNSISVWDKKTGSQLALFGLLNNGITGRPLNPQKMTFDLAGNLWVVDGGTPALDCSYPNTPLMGNRNGAGADPLWKTYGSLVKIVLAGAGSQENPPTIASIVPIRSLGGGSVLLSNPVDIALSPVTGHLFVADGGGNQQVFEFDPKTLNVDSTTGTPGGYGQNRSGTSNSCKATITSSTLWLDYIARGTGVTRPWIAVDNEDGLWIGDYSTSRILRFAKNAGQYQYTGMSEMNRWQYLVSVPRNAPTRVFAGTNGMLEYQVDYPNPDRAEGISAPAGNTAFSAVPVRNWLPCVLQAEWRSGGYPDMTLQLESVEQFAGGTFGSVLYHSANPALAARHPLLALPVSGVLTAEDGPASQNANQFPYTKGALFDASGNFYTGSISNGACGQAGKAGFACETPTQYAVNGVDAHGFPTWSQKGRVLGTVSLSLQGGDAQGKCGSDGCDFAPTANNIIPFYSGTGWDWQAASTCEPTNIACSPATAPTYHLGGMRVGDLATAWHAQLEANIEYPNLVNDIGFRTPSVPSASSNVNNLGLYSTWNSYYGFQNMGIGTHSIDNFIFAAVNGNWQQFSCQFYQYTDDGMFVGQFGWRSTGYYPANGYSGGAPESTQNEALAPGRCANPQMFKVVKVNNDYYLYVTDEGYRAGVQRWHVWNTASIGWLTAATSTTLARQSAPLTLR